MAVGDAGTALVSSDAARTWRRARTGVGVPLAAVTCPSARNCVAVGDGGTVLASGDSGRHWHRSASGLDVVDGVACSSVDACTAVTSSAVTTVISSDGKRWVQGTIPFSPLDALSPLDAVTCSASTCIAVGGRGLVGRSADGGGTWSAGQDVADADLHAVACATPSHCVAVGGQGTIEVTDDAGAVWVQVHSGTGQTLLGVACPAPATCVAVGSGGTVLTSADGGADWTVRAGRPVRAPALSVLVVGDSFAHTLAAGLAHDATAYGIALTDGSLDGCALTRGSPVLAGTELLTVSGPCAPTGPGWPAQYEADLSATRPAVSLVVLGPWDLTTRSIDGQWLAPGQPAYDAYYRGQLEAAVQLLTARGGRVVIATAPEVLTLHAPPCRPGVAAGAGCPTESKRVAALDAVAHEVADAHPTQVTLVDLGGRLDPGGRFAGTIDHVVVRAADGVHLTEPGGEWLTPWLLPRIVAARPAG